MLLFSIIPFGYARWKRNREFNQIRKEIRKLSTGEDFKFTRQRYRENRDVFNAYVFPVFFILLNGFTSLPFGKGLDEMNPVVSGVIGIYLFLVLAKDILTHKKETVIFLEDLVSEDELKHFREKRESLNYGYALYFVGTNETAYPIKKEAIPHLANVSRICTEENNLKEHVNTLKNMKNSLSTDDFFKKMEELEARRYELSKESDEALDWIFIAMGKKDSPKVKAEKQLASERKLKSFLEETEDEDLGLIPVPILELQELVKASVDEDIKKEAEEALAQANQLFEESKKRNADFAKDFLRMKQKSTIKTALQEMRKL